MKSAVFIIGIFLILLVAGCVSSDCQRTPYIECNTISFQEPKIEKDCNIVELPYSWSDLRIDESFSAEKGRYIIANVKIKNVDLKSAGEWKVRFTFTTLDEGKTVTDINFTLQPNEEQVFSTPYDVAIGEEYRADYTIAAPKKEVCEYTLNYETKTRKECSDEIKYQDTCSK